MPRIVRARRVDELLLHTDLMAFREPSGTDFVERLATKASHPPRPNRFLHFVCPERRYFIEKHLKVDIYSVSALRCNPLLSFYVKNKLLFPNKKTVMKRTKSILRTIKKNVKAEFAVSGESGGSLALDGFLLSGVFPASVWHHPLLSLAVF